MTTRAPSAAQNSRNAPGPLGDRDRQQRLASFAELGALGDEPQPIEVHVGAAEHRGEPLPAHAAASRRSDFSPASASAPAGSDDRARVVEDVLDRGADLVVVDADDLVDRRLHDRERVLADLLHRDAVGEQPDLVEPDAAAGRQRLRHRVGIDRLDADHLHVGPERLDVGADAGDQPAAADGHEDRRRDSGLCRSISTRDRALAGDDQRIVEGMDEHQAALRRRARSQCCCASA